MAFKQAAVRFGGLSSAAAMVLSSQAGMFLMFGLVATTGVLIVVLALTGTFGADGHRADAQTVLAILLGRDHSRRSED